MSLLPAYSWFQCTQFFQNKMMLTPQLFHDIIRPCPACETPYDIRLHAPHVLPCSHTFCMMCLSKHEQRKKKKCPICDAKYSKFAPNLALMEVSERIDERRVFLESDTRQCDECDNRVKTSMMRRCETCEKQLMTRTEYKLECIICLECCVNSHNGHNFIRFNTAPSSSIESSPMLQQRARHPSTSSTVSVHFRHPSTVSGRLSTTKGLINTIKSWSFRSSNELSFVLSPPSKLAFSEEDIVMQCQSPFYENETAQSQHQILRNRMSSSRFLCYDPNNPDNISVDSVFVESPQSLPNNLTPRMSSSCRSSCIQHKNDSGVMMTPSSSSSPATPSVVTSHPHFSRSATSLRIPSPATTSKIQGIQNFFGSSRVPRNNRMQMGVADIIRTPHRPMPHPLYTSTPNNLNGVRNSERMVYPPTPTRQPRQYF
ncbi:hypothetical protein L3Y34_001320 [Caenorhabditis briggsae]|uniref:RING-type domain-containing protein n=2 Tax=Caenorhabditis briggsae TaxID=6238 RepID=A0AAE9DC54_CAEBR|nr:hypothetical protein L3Y34_001320 [Caenorhabditis briggsae]